MFDFYVSARCPLFYSIATLGCRVFCCGGYYVSVSVLSLVCLVTFVRSVLLHLIFT